MWNESRRALRWAAALFLAATSTSPAARGQAQIETKLTRQLRRLDLGVSVMGNFSGNTAGRNYATTTPAPVQAQNLTTSTTSGTGGLVALRYTKSPLLGAEFTYSFARYSTFFNPPPGGVIVAVGGVQANANEVTFGYVAHGPELTGFGIKPFGAAGAGTTLFSPTLRGGGQDLFKQGRATYYYALGAEAPIFSHVGLRAQFRQSFYLLPDFTANFLTIKQRTSSLEPSFGFYLHY